MGNPNKGLRPCTIEGHKNSYLWAALKGRHILGLGIAQPVESAYSKSPEGAQYHDLRHRGCERVMALLRRKPGILPNDWIGLAGRVANACPPWRGEWRINILSIKSRKTRRMALVMYD